jgi:Lectin C-type domain
MNELYATLSSGNICKRFVSLLRCANGVSEHRKHIRTLLLNRCKQLYGLQKVNECNFINNAFSVELRYNNRPHWTAGMDISCPGKFQWCTGYRQSITNTSINWAPGQPDNQFGIEDCVQLTLNIGPWTSSAFYDASCSNSYFYICEVIAKFYF